MLWTINDELVDWLLENDKESTQNKINKVREVLNDKQGISFSLLDYDNNSVELHIQIDDYEDENNIEQIHFTVDVDTGFEEGFKNFEDSYKYFNRRVKELQ